jgi:hypothetical protein
MIRGYGGLLWILGVFLVLAIFLPQLPEIWIDRFILLILCFGGGFFYWGNRAP